MTTVSTSRRVVVRVPRAVDVSFPALGSTVRLIASGPTAALAVERGRAEVLDYHRRLSRFLPASELCALNADPRRVVPASQLLRSAVRAGLWAATLSDGLVDPCLLDALEAAGYDRSHEPTAQPSRPSGPRRPARPNPWSRWREIRADDTAGTVQRPRGIRLDLGGSGKGHIADLLSRHFENCHDWVVDCGGDIRVGAGRTIEIAHPLDVRPAAQLHLGAGAVATSSVVSRAWLRGDGRRAHHLLDPSTGEPVWTGLLSATAVAPTTLHAETLAKIAVLTGADAAREALAGHGGVLVHEDGAVEVVEPDVDVAA
jgi:thiamine biosynthesis lipoprotein